MMKLSWKTISFWLLAIIIILFTITALRQRLTIQNQAKEIPKNLAKHSSAVSKSPFIKKLFPNDFIPGEVIVKFRNSKTTNSQKDYLVQALPGMTVKNIITHKLGKNNDTYSVIKLNKEDSVLNAVKLLKKDANVQFAEPNYIVTAFNHVSDEYYLDRNPPSSDRNLAPEAGGWNPGFDYQWNLRAVSQPHDLPPANKSIIVAVIDTGVDYNHRELFPTIWRNTNEIDANGIDDDKNGYVDDIRGWDAVAYEISPVDHPEKIYTETADNDPMDQPKENYFEVISPHVVGGGHGTHVTGIVASSINNYGGIGVAPGIMIMPLRIFTADGWATNEGVAAIIVYAVNNGAKVINLSMGGIYESELMHYAIQYAVSKDVVVVAAAGNEGINIIEYPSGFPEVISVSALDINENKSDYSSYGKVEVAAPGDDIIAPRSQGTDAYCLFDTDCQSGVIAHTLYIAGKNQDHYVMSGTSMAAPHVSALAGLILMKNPSLTSAQVRSVILSSADDKGTPGKDIVYGYGKINVSRALNEMNISLPGIEKKNWKFTVDYACEDNSKPWAAPSSVRLETYYDGAGGGVKSYPRNLLDDKSLTYSTDNIDTTMTLSTNYGPMNPERLTTLRTVPHASIKVTDRGDEAYWNITELPSGEYKFIYDLDSKYCHPYEWEINMRLACTNGHEVERNATQPIYLIWPPGPVKWTTLPASNEREHHFTIRAEPDYHNIYVMLRNQDKYLRPNPALKPYEVWAPGDEIFHFANFASKSIYPEVDWQANNSIMDINWPDRTTGKNKPLNFEFFAPDDWCDGVSSGKTPSIEELNRLPVNEIDDVDKKTLEEAANNNPSVANQSSDINHDGVTNTVDIFIVVDSLGQTGPDLQGDLNGDNKVNALDLSLAINKFGN